MYASRALLYTNGILPLHMCIGLKITAFVGVFNDASVCTAV